MLIYNKKEKKTEWRHPVIIQLSQGNKAIDPFE